MASQSARSAKTPNTPLSANVDLDVAWKATISKCQNITNWDLNANKQLTVDDVVLKITPTKRDGKAESHEQAKKIFRRSLECIQRFGVIAAQGASMVFGPSNQCFNAVNFVIMAAQGYAEAIETLGILMERIYAFLDRLKTYLEDSSADVKLDPRLRVTVYRVLDHFLVIMGNSHKITSSFRGKLKLGFKITVFGEDGGIKDALAKLETLVSDVTRAEITTIVKTLSEAARSIRGVDKKLDSISENVEKTVASTSHLQAAEERRSDADKEQKETAALRKALGIDEKKEPWQDRQDELTREHIPGTGQWLLDYRYPSYARWSDPKETALNIIGVRGDQNFGKSFLSSVVIDDLLEKHRSNPRVCVAYYYFNAYRDPGDARESVNKALKAIMWQLTQTKRDASRDFRRLAIKTCEGNPDLSKTDRLWNLLITEHERSLNATFYIVLDGLEPETESGRPLARILDGLTASAHEQPPLRTRVFVTGRPTSMNALAQDMSQKLLEINLAPPERQDQPAVNQKDIMLFAEAKLDKMSFYRGAMESDDRELKEKVKITLARGVRGDYFTLISKLGEIAKARDIDKVEEILRRADEDRAQVIERQIKQLNESLSPDEIDEVNHILIWTIAGDYWPSLEMLEAALRLRDSKTRLLGPLVNRIRELYADLFIEDVDDSEGDTYIQLRSEEIENYFLKAEKQAVAVGSDAIRRNVEGGFQEAEIALMERIIKTHMLHIFGVDGQGIYQRYGFTEFFDAKRGPTNAQIHYHRGHANVVMVRSCLIALCDKYDEPEFAPLQEYGMAVAHHLKQQVDEYGLEQVDKISKYEIGRKLVRLLRDETFIDKWLHGWILQQEDWVDKTDLVDATHKWLTDVDVQKALQDMPQEKKWVESLTADGTQTIKVLANVAVGIIKLWLNGDKPGWSAPFTFVMGYYAQLHRTQIPADEVPAVEGIEAVAAWAKGELPHDADDSQWNFALGVTLQFFGHWDAALSRYYQAIEAQPDLWRARQRISVTLASKGEPKGAIEAMNALIEREKWRLDSDEQFANDYWDHMLPSIVAMNLDLKDNPAAEDVSKKVVARLMKQDSFNDSAQMEVKTLMKIQFEQRKHVELVQLLEDLGSKVDLEGNWLVKMMYSFHAENEFHDALLDIGKHADYSTRIMEVYQAAIDGAISATSSISIDERIPLHIRLRTLQARIAWHLGAEEQREAALSTWEEIAHIEPDEDDVKFLHIVWSRRFAARWAGNGLVSAALQKSSSMQDHEVAGKYLQRLEALQSLDHAIGRQPVADVRVPLARILFLMKQTKRAREVVRDYVAVAVQLLEESAGDNMQAVDRLVNAFLALEDDVNARAAFTLFDRKPPPDMPPSASGDDVPSREEPDFPDTDDPRASGPTVDLQGRPGEGRERVDGGRTLDKGNCTGVDIAKTEEPETISTTVDTPVNDDNASVGHSSVVPVEQKIKHSSGAKTNGATTPSPSADTLVSVENDNKEAAASVSVRTNQISSEITSPASKLSLSSLTRLDTSVNTALTPDDASAEIPPSPVLNYIGVCSTLACEHTWTYPSDMYGCRDCYKIICAPCHEELTNGRMTKISCDRVHSHLHIPPVDAQKFIDRPKSIVWVGGEEVQLQQWLNSIKEDWELEERSVKARERWKRAARTVRSFAITPDRHDSASPSS